MKCEECGKKNATYALPEDKTFVYCFEHKTKTMIHIHTKKCAGMDDGKPCMKRPNYGLAGTKKAIYCKKHKEPDMIDVKSIRCAEEGCDKQPNFNSPEEKRALYCIQHAKDGMVDVKNQKCLEKDCRSQPAYGFKGHKILYCTKHKKEGMIDLKNVYCRECSTIASFGTIEGKPEYCATHKKPDMVIVRSAIICSDEGCCKQATYGEVGGKVSHCSEHAFPGMVDLRHNKCEHPDGCDLNPSFGFEGDKARFCWQHKETNMLYLVCKRCDEDGCNGRAIYNFDRGMKPAFCRQHAKPTMINVVCRVCKLCPTQVCNDKYKGYCLRCFVYTFPDESVARHYRVKERHVHDFLSEHYGNTIFTYNKTIDGGCSKRRPDWFFECLSHTVIVECNENQHDCYLLSCEIQRRNELYIDLAYRPMIMIFFNPDGFINKEGKKVQSSFKYNNLGLPVINDEKDWQQRLNALKGQIDHHIKNVPTEALTIVELFYDETVEMTTT